MKKFQNKKYKNSRPKWNDFTQWWNKMNPLTKGVWPLWVNTPLQMKNCRSKNNCSPFLSNPTSLSWSRFKEEYKPMKNSKPSWNFCTKNSLGKRANNKLKSRLKNKTKSRKRKNLKSLRFSLMTPGQMNRRIRISEKISIKNTRISIRNFMRSI